LIKHSGRRVRAYCGAAARRRTLTAWHTDGHRDGI